MISFSTFGLWAHFRGYTTFPSEILRVLRHPGIARQAQLDGANPQSCQAAADFKQALACLLAYHAQVLEHVLRNFCQHLFPKALNPKDSFAKWALKTLGADPDPSAARQYRLVSCVTVGIS